MIFSLDGVEFNVDVIKLDRSFAVTDTDNSGRTLDGGMHRDIIGTYYNYSMALETKSLDLASYDQLYEMLSAPITSHTLIVPYGQENLEFQAYVTSGADGLKKRGVKNLWSGLTVSFIAMVPQRRP
jgi:hypothetical protein